MFGSPQSSCFILSKLFDNLNSIGLFYLISAVKALRELLLSCGFRELREDEPWRLAPGDRAFLTKNFSTLYAIGVGGAHRPGNGFTLFAAHTDSPSLRVKPRSDRQKEGYQQLGVETYGGGLWYTWLDRDLTLAGRVIVGPRPAAPASATCPSTVSEATTSTASACSGQLRHCLVNLVRPIACVPSLAIHLNREINSKGFLPNPEQHLAPIICTSFMDQVNERFKAENSFYI
ncbi:unnamed protein product [Protopolystoma xenopodis]|uniref:Aspartyl aminopeptidase n=1 Tax=Protopolystoma xenopodis TaxID=117903 RepID=A0A3S4ZXU7_9PLAT|nr:unnamed protein product [Protopolystoma xenopodis]